MAVQDDLMCLNVVNEAVHTPPVAFESSKSDKKRRKNKLPERRSKQKRSRPGQRGAVSTLKGYSLQDGQSKEEVEGAQADYESRQKRSRKQSEKIQDNDEDEVALKEAIDLSLKRDSNLASMERIEADTSEAEEEDARKAGIVSFVDERYDHSRMMKRKRKPAVDDVKEQNSKKRRGLGNVHPTIGELTHASAVVPPELQAVVMGDKAVSTFTALGLSDSLCQHLTSLGFRVPTRIQQQCIPVLLAGKDTLVNAPTGSGKTLAYLAPIANFLQGEQPRLNRGDGAFAIILGPTRELCFQIHDVLTNILRRYFWLICGAITGGENRGKEKARLRKGLNVVVATPGRLLDHLEKTSAFHTNELRWLILDEADRLLDLGFEQKIRDIVKILDKRIEESSGRRRQTVLLSATMTSKLEPLISLSLRDAASVGLSKASLPKQDNVEEGEEASARDIEQVVEEDTFSIPDQLQQRFIQVAGKQRLAALAGILCRGTKDKAECKIVIFMSSCDSVEFHHQILNDAFKFATGKPLVDCPMFKLHGSLPQKIRTQTFLDFLRCPRGILISTDVAARGLDFPKVTCIVQYDPPGETTEYVHRVGRTARMGLKGEAILFLLPSELAYLEWLSKCGCKVKEMAFSESVKDLPHLPINPDQKKQLFDQREEAFGFQLRIMSAVSKDPGLKELAGNAFRSYVRAYATHPAKLREIFHVKRLHLGHVAHSFALKDPPRTFMMRPAPKAASKATQQMARKGKTLSSPNKKARRKKN